MLVLNRTYAGYDGKEHTEDFYFNLSQAEIAEMELEASGGLVETMQKLVDAKDGKAIIKIIKSIILKSYGVMSEDGKRFIKKQENTDAFEQTEAYSDIFMELAFDEEAMSNFIVGVLPTKLQNEIKNKLPEIKEQLAANK